MDHQHVTEKADVWSFGVVLWEMLTLEVPFHNMPPAQLIAGEWLLLCLLHVAFAVSLASST